MSWCCPEAQQGALRHVLVPRVEPKSLVTGEGVSEGHDALDGLRESLGGSELSVVAGLVGSAVS